MKTNKEIFDEIQKQNEIEKFILRIAKDCYEKYNKEIFFICKAVEVEYISSANNEIEDKNCFMIYVYLKFKMIFTEYRLNRIEEIKEEIFNNNYNNQKKQEYNIDYKIVEIFFDEKKRNNKHF